MANDVKKYSLYLIAIVAIVAVVGIVVMTTNYGGFSGTTTEEALLSEESSDLAGQAYAFGGCIDEDAASTNDPAQLFVKSKTAYNIGIKEDSCYTFKSGKTYLFEGTCYNGNFRTWQKNCAELNIGKSGTDYKCVDGACVDTTPKPTCTPGPTGKGKCVKNQWNGLDYKKEYQNTDCTTYLSDTDKQGCGYNDDTLCKDEVGCCEYEVIKSECQDNTYYNQSKNICTGELKDNYKDCTQIIDWSTKQPNVCSSNQFVSNCVINCNEGDVAYSCQLNSNNKLYQYMKSTCKVNQGVDYYSKQWVYWDNMGLIYWSETCPTGATCYNPEGKCA